MSHPLSYNLRQIAEWVKTDKVSLPTVQRGFVWRPKQIEDLWDSLLRGYPVGAFVLSPEKDDRYQILDGQQRATAITLGFNKATFRGSQDLIKVFIDLEAPEKGDSRKFIFRVITRSHPWGYRRSENNKTLPTENIRKALDSYDVSDPMSADLACFFPFDAKLPIPFQFFVEAAIENYLPEKIYTNICAWEQWQKVKQKWMDSQGEINNIPDEAALDSVILGKIGNILSNVSQILNEETGQKIPALYMDLKSMLQEDDHASMDEADEVENLFVRLNAGGTQLSGEELNYSILKAHISRDTQDKIEAACKSLFKPARFITIAFRLYQHKNSESHHSDALTMRIRPKQFQRTISNDIENFEAFLNDIIENKAFNKEPLLFYVKDLLAYKESQTYGLPFLLYSKISDLAPELFFMLLYRVLIKGDRISKENERQHRAVLGMITLFLWFGRGENLKDHSKLLLNIWPAVKGLSQESFWSSETVQRATLDKVVLSFPFYKDLRGVVNYKVPRQKNSFSKFVKEIGEEYETFIKRMIGNKDLLLYGQRTFIESYFREEQYRLEDTNVPFDWDHISPQNLVRRKRKISPILKEWYSTIGNFRAWPYALNRMDSDNNPTNKLNPLRKDNPDLNQVKRKWELFISKNDHLISDLSQLNKKLLEWSFCKKEWDQCNPIDIKNDWIQPTELIINRNILLIKEWYKELNIESFQPEKIKENVDVIANLVEKKRWEWDFKKPEFFYGLFNDEDKRALSSSFKVNDSEIRFYFYYSIEDQNFLSNGGIKFGVFEESGAYLISVCK